METPIGFTPRMDGLDLSGLDITPEALEDSITVYRDEWITELEGIDEWFAEFGESLPGSIAAEREELRRRLLP